MPGELSKTAIEATIATLTVELSRAETKVDESQQQLALNTSKRDELAARIDDWEYVLTLLDDE